VYSPGVLADYQAPNTTLVWKDFGSHLLSIEDNKLKSESIAISPNPTKNYVTISSTSNLQINKVEIYNLIGALVLEQINTNTIDLTNLNQGVYLAKIYSNAGTVTKKLAKQ